MPDDGDFCYQAFILPPPRIFSPLIVVSRCPLHQRWEFHCFWSRINLLMWRRDSSNFIHSTTFPNDPQFCFRTFGPPSSTTTLLYSTWMTNNFWTMKKSRKRPWRVWTRLRMEGRQTPLRQRQLIQSSTYIFLIISILSGSLCLNSQQWFPWLDASSRTFACHQRLRFWASIGGTTRMYPTSNPRHGHHLSSKIWNGKDGRFRFGNSSAIAASRRGSFGFGYVPHSWIGLPNQQGIRAFLQVFALD